MTCQCKAKPDCLNYGDEQVFAKTFELVAKGNWLRLYRCPVCFTYWKLDVDDRSDLAIKVPDQKTWDTFDDRSLRRDFVIRTHGGEGDEICIWANCHNHVLKNMAICADHAFPELP